MNNKIILESLAMDLKRVALGYQRNSLGMANRFYEEAHKKKGEIDLKSVKPYLRKIISKIELLKKNNSKRIAEDALMLSTLLQNYCYHNFRSL